MAEQVPEVVGRDSGEILLRCQVHEGTQLRQRREFSSRVIAPDALGRVDEPAEPRDREDSEQHLAYVRGLPSRSSGENQIVQIVEDPKPHVAQKADGVVHDYRKNPWGRGQARVAGRQHQETAKLALPLEP